MAQKLQETAERPKRALLVSVAASNSRAKSGRRNENAPSPEIEFSDEDAARELLGLAQTLELEIAGHRTVNVRDRQPRFGIGSGKAEELAEEAKQLEADCLVLDWDPSPSQQRNWEDLAGIPVLDRQELIIRIFAMRAATKEAVLQIELAELSYRLPRLAHKYIDLSRQRGGRYGTRGAGETRLETDRRKMLVRIHRLEKEIEEVAKQRQVQRRQRQRQGLPVCAVVGYTNAGKSSLFNALAGSAALVEDKLFATLDATTRRFEPAPAMPVLLTDTVGFIRRLPHSLIKAFRSTLEEAAHASLLLHVLDCSDARIASCYQTTVTVLRELGAGEIPGLSVLNKVDLLAEKAEAEALLARFPNSLAVSARRGDGLDELKKRIAISVLNLT
ncbi:MAG: GTPase HflX [Treponema sp.]|jgi:GTP-binding protein HflX|nr:GTPase HflX [Treponema sp.]